ncbi:hypothetical protein [Yoonia sp. MH D7]
MSRNWTHVKFAAVNAVCLPRLPSLVAQWLPEGRLQGHDWVALNPTRADRHAGSFRINVENGLWADFATDDRGGDPISLYAYLNRLSQVAAARELAASLGVAA